MDTMLSRTVENGGGTFEAGTFLPFEPTDGFAVGMGGVKVDAATATDDLLTFWARKVTTEHGASFVGTWLTDGVIHIDAVTYVKAIDRALMLGRQWHQLAVYSFAMAESLDILEEVPS